MEYSRIIAVDFDGCLCEKAWPDIGAPIERNIRHLLTEKASGSKIILWTCREGELLDQAVAWCHERGLTFDAVNEQLPEMKELYGNDSRKVSAAEYWDDRAVPMSRETAAHYDLMSSALITWGEVSQMNMMIEEMSELAKALLKYRRVPFDVCKLAQGEDQEGMEALREAGAAVEEEIADVQIVLDQMKLLFRGWKDYEREKLERLAQRIEEASAAK